MLCYFKTNFTGISNGFFKLHFYKQICRIGTSFNRNMKKSKFLKHDFTPVALEDSIQVNLTFETK